MILIGEILMFFFGLTHFFRGRISVSQTEEVYGTRARVLSLLLIAPLPVSFAIGLVVGFALAVFGKRFEVGPYFVVLALLECCVLGICIFLFYAIGRALAEPMRRAPSPNDELLRIQPLNDQYFTDH
jgi:hypothetical protein